MQERLLKVLFISGLMLLGACAQTTGRTGPKEAAPLASQPKKVYAIDRKQAWDLIIRGLNQEGVLLEMTNEETGLIRTGYQNLSPWERNKCELRLSQEPEQKTFIKVHCQYESRKEATEPFKVFPYGVPLEAVKAEEEIYRRIEAYILPLEGGPKVREELAKDQPQPSPPPAVTAPPAKTDAISLPNPPAAPAPPQEEVPTPPPAAVSSQPSPVMTEVESVPMAVPEVRETLPAKPEPATPPTPPTVVAQESRGANKEKLRTYLTTIGTANVRVAPSVKSKVLAVLKKGERVEKVGESGAWTKIKLTTGEVAWVHSDFVQVATTETTRETKIFLATKAIVKMRAEPSSNSEVVLVLKKGREVEKIGESGGYTKVRLSWGDTGWVPTRFLERVR